jgi:ubiquitin-like domain-containing CTD phosphatase 1
MILFIKYKGDVHEVPVDPTETVLDVKERVEAITCVSKAKQKLLGLRLKGVPGVGAKVTDETRVDDLDLRGHSAKKPVMLLGTPEAAHQRLRQEEEMQMQPHCQAFDEDEAEGEGEVCGDGGSLASRPDVVAKLQSRYQRANILQLHPPKKGKCVVFDIDYTFFDLGGTSERPEELLRPYTKELMRYVNAELGFDIVIWSANSMKWITVKLKELGLVGDTVGFKITACMDYTAMLTLSSSELGEERKRKRMSATFDCKPLAVLFHRYSEYYSPDQTVMLDDLRRNFILNPKQGLTVRPFRKATTQGKQDTEFESLMAYFRILGGMESFDALDHNVWKRYLK